jgi:hypothetical protein
LIFIIIPAVLLIAAVLWDVFESVVLPRRVQRSLRPARLFYRGTWRTWTAVADRTSGVRETLLSIYGPLSLIMLLGVWAVALVFAFGLVQYALGSDLITATGHANLRTDMYLSGTTFFTLGLGDVVPHSASGRAATVIEAGTGFGFLALVIGYLPVFYTSFSRREVNISLLDGRAGSPPTAGRLLTRYKRDPDGLARLLADWERWAADLLESHLSYPVLAYFRSQHERQSWVAALTVMLDVSSVVQVRDTGRPAESALLTFAMARHAAVDLSQIADRDPQPLASDRLTPDALAKLWASYPRPDGAAEPTASEQRQLASLRATYEPFVNALALYLRMPLPPWIPEAGAIAAWESSPTRHTAEGLTDPIEPPTSD